MSIYTNKNIHSCIRLHVFKICFCCFLDIHLYSNNLSTIAMTSSLLMSEIFPAFFCCSNNVNLSFNSSGSVGKNIAFEIPEAMIAGD